MACMLRIPHPNRQGHKDPRTGGAVISKEDTSAWKIDPILSSSKLETYIWKVIELTSLVQSVDWARQLSPLVITRWKRKTMHSIECVTAKETILHNKQDILNPVV